MRLHVAAGPIARWQTASTAQSHTWVVLLQCISSPQSASELQRARQTRCSVRRTSGAQTAPTELQGLVPHDCSHNRTSVWVPGSSRMPQLAPVPQLVASHAGLDSVGRQAPRAKLVSQ
jgi:hypothetical protein